ncbi:unnamed protein product, partial [Meganyctiphanes norvegica]
MASLKSSELNISHSMVYVNNFTLNPILCFRGYSSHAMCKGMNFNSRNDERVMKYRNRQKKHKICEKNILILSKVAVTLYGPVAYGQIAAPLQIPVQIRARKNVPLSSEEIFSRQALEKEWSRYKYQQHLAETAMIQTVISSQEKALEELRKESEELWLEAIQLNPTLLPLSLKGPVKTAPIANYDAPDGEYIDITKNWD